MSDEPISDAPRPAAEQDAPAPVRPPDERENRPSQAEGERDDDADEGAGG